MTSEYTLTSSPRLVTIQDFIDYTEPMKELPSGGWITRCPAHEDGRPSLRVNQASDGSVLTHCYAGCEFEAIIKELQDRKGVGPFHSNGYHEKPAAAKPPDRKRWHDIESQPGYVEFYQYDHFRTVRTQRDGNKSILPWRPEDPADLEGWWINQRGPEVTLYRQSELLAADKDELKAITEGEKDANRLAALGYVAVTNPGGASFWRDGFSDLFTGQDVLVIQDNDKAGADRTERIGKSLVGKVKSLRVLRFPELAEGGDVTDYLDGGATFEQLKERIASAPEWRPSQPASLSDTTTGAVSERKLNWQTARQVAERTPENPDFILPGFLASGAITELDGPAKSAGKTTWATHMAKAALTGGKFMDRIAKKGPIVYLTEQTPSTMREPLRRADLLDHDDLHLLHWGDTGDLPWPAIVEAAREKAKQEGARVLVVDTLPQFAGLKGDSENHSGASLEAMKPLQLAAAEGLAVLIVRHDRKSGGEVGESARGSSAYTGSVDIVIQISRGEGQTRPGIRKLKTLSRFDETPDELVIELTEDGYICHGDGMAVKTTEARKTLLDALPADEGAAMSEDELTKASGVSRTLVRNLLRAFVEEGEVIRAGRGVSGSPYRYWREIGDQCRSDTLRTVVVSDRNPGPEQASFADDLPISTDDPIADQSRSDTTTSLRVSDRHFTNSRTAFADSGVVF